MLDEFVAATGYNRKYAITLLLHGPPQKSSKKKGSLIYGPESLRLWRKRGRLAGIYVAKRLHPFLPDLVDALKRHGELSISAETKAKMLQMSSAAIDRRLKRIRSRLARARRSTTKPGTLLKHAIPIRTYADWDEQRPGFR